MRRWIRGPGDALRLYKPDEPGPKYLFNSKDRPFPLNPNFVSQPVLSEEAREAVWRAIMVEGQPIKAVSARYGIDIRRVAAVVRLMEIEKAWDKEVSDAIFATPLWFSSAWIPTLPQRFA
jgi:hypothetical protein